MNTVPVDVVLPCRREGPLPDQRDQRDKTQEDVERPLLPAPAWGAEGKLRSAATPPPENQPLDEQHQAKEVGPEDDRKGKGKERERAPHGEDQEDHEQDTDPYRDLLIKFSGPPLHP